MKITFSNVLAVASIMVWATAWAATEKQEVASTANVSAAQTTKAPVEARTDQAKSIAMRVR